MNKLSESFKVEYIGGHPSYMKKDKGELRISPSDISFWSGRFSKEMRFSVLLKDISKVDVQESNKITLNSIKPILYKSLLDIKT